MERPSGEQCPLLCAGKTRSFGFAEERNCLTPCAYPDSKKLTAIWDKFAKENYSESMPLESVSIVTTETPGKSPLAPIHHRIPLMFTDREMAMDWLHSEEPFEGLLDRALRKQMAYQNGKSVEELGKTDAEVAEMRAAGISVAPYGVKAEPGVKSEPDVKTEVKEELEPPLEIFKVDPAVNKNSTEGPDCIKPLKEGKLDKGKFQGIWGKYLKKSENQAVKKQESSGSLGGNVKKELSSGSLGVPGVKQERREDEKENEVIALDSSPEKEPAGKRAKTEVKEEKAN